jgi:orotidine-5'-phosphate decarboxylase
LIDRAAGPRVIVALDFPTAGAALDLAARLSPRQCRLKVGLELYTAAGPALVARLVENGFDVFLDLKYHDIPNTVARACAAAAALGVWMLNVHTLGGTAMLRAAREALVALPRPPRLVGVTLLTSLDAAELARLGLGSAPLAEQVERLARLAHEAGLDGVVCSPQEAGRLRARFGPGFTLVTPGVRAGAAQDDQSRTLSATAALAAGADYLVIGRPITRATDPPAALNDIVRELA